MCIRDSLYSICTIGTISVITKTVDDDVALMYLFDSNGVIIDKVPTHQGNGTTIIVTNLFKDLPVRKQLYRTDKSLKDEVKRIEELLISYGLVYHNARLTLTNNKKEIWRKNRASNLHFSIRELFKSRISQELTEVLIEEDSFKIHGFIPKKTCDFQVISRGTGDRIFISVNKRPVSIAKIKKVCKNIDCLSSFIHTFLTLSLNEVKRSFTFLIDISIYQIKSISRHTSVWHHQE